MALLTILKKGLNVALFNYCMARLCDYYARAVSEAILSNFAKGYIFLNPNVHPPKILELNC